MEPIQRLTKHLTRAQNGIDETLTEMDKILAVFNVPRDVEYILDEAKRTKSSAFSNSYAAGNFYLDALEKTITAQSYLKRSRLPLRAIAREEKLLSQQQTAAVDAITEEFLSLATSHCLV